VEGILGEAFPATGDSLVVAANTVSDSQNRAVAVAGTVGERWRAGIRGTRRWAEERLRPAGSQDKDPAEDNLQAVAVAATAVVAVVDAADIGCKVGHRRAAFAAEEGEGPLVLLREMLEEEQPAEKAWQCQRPSPRWSS